MLSDQSLSATSFHASGSVPAKCSSSDGESKAHAVTIYGVAVPAPLRALALGDGVLAPLSEAGSVGLGFAMISLGLPYL